MNPGGLAGWGYIRQGVQLVVPRLVRACIHEVIANRLGYVMSEIAASNASARL
jgi:hypothetical protein